MVGGRRFEEYLSEHEGNELFRRVGFFPWEEGKSLRIPKDPPSPFGPHSRLSYVCMNVYARNFLVLYPTFYLVGISVTKPCTNF